MLAVGTIHLCFVVLILFLIACSILLHLQSLKKEADQLKVNLLKAEAVTKAAKKKYHDENEKLNKLLSQFKAADDIRQEAYAQLQSLKKESYEKVLLNSITLSYNV